MEIKKITKLRLITIILWSIAIGIIMATLAITNGQSIMELFGYWVWR